MQVSALAREERGQSAAFTISVRRALLAGAEAVPSYPLAARGRTLGAPGQTPTTRQHTDTGPPRLYLSQLLFPQHGAQQALTSPCPSAGRGRSPKTHCCQGAECSGLSPHQLHEKSPS